MKYIITILFFCAAICDSFSQTGKVIVTVKGVDLKKGGELSVGFFNDRNFPKVGRQSFGKVKEVDGAVMELVFEEVPVGQYGIAVFQDIDSNKDLKTNFIGLPTEPIGFSNDAPIKFGPPSFADAKIDVEEDRTLNYVIQLR
jgi:uncharacterized protein (DUF2141 family)